MFLRLAPPDRRLSLGEIFGLESLSTALQDAAFVAQRLGDRTHFQIGLSSIEFLRPDLSLPAYFGFLPADGMAPIYHLFDRTGGGKNYSQRVTRKHVADFRGGRLTYDEHDGTDFVCPNGTPIVAAADGTVVMVRRRFLRGGLTIAVDHGQGMVTQYTHCARALASPGQKVTRGDTIALSGSQGMDMTSFFPWIPPHLHFMVWDRGRPVDPFLNENEAERPGTWSLRNRPGHTKVGNSQGGALACEISEIDSTALRRCIAACTDRRILAEFEELADFESGQAALFEDALHHDAHAWSEDFRHTTVRPRRDSHAEEKAQTIKLSLPLSPQYYSGSYFADTPFSRPSSASRVDV